MFYCKDAFEGLAKMDQLVDGEAREALIAKTRDAAQQLREQPEATDDDAPPVTDASVRSAAATDNPIPEPPFWGVREIEVPMDEVYHHLDTHVLFKLHWGGRGVKGEEWKQLVGEDFKPRLERMWREQTYLHPRALLGYFPCNSDGNELIVWDPGGFRSRPPARARAPRVPAPAPPRPDLPGRLLPAGGVRRGRRGRAPGGHRRRRGHRADGASSRPTASSPSSCSSTGSACRPPRGWPSGCTRASAPTSASRRRRAAATRGATPPAPSSQSTRRCSGCSTRRRSGCACRAASRSSPSSRRSRSSPTTRRPSTSG